MTDLVGLAIDLKLLHARLVCWPLCYWSGH